MLSSVDVWLTSVEVEFHVGVFFAFSAVVVRAAFDAVHVQYKFIIRCCCCGLHLYISQFELRGGCLRA